MIMGWKLCVFVCVYIYSSPEDMFIDERVRERNIKWGEKHGELPPTEMKLKGTAEKNQSVKTKCLVGIEDGERELQAKEHGSQLW